MAALRRLILVLALVAAVAVTGIALGQSGTEVPGPGSKLLVSGRKLDPLGKLTALGNFPAGGALTTDGHFLWTLSAGRGPNDVRIVQVAATLRCKKPRRRRHLKGKALRRYRKRVKSYKKCRKRRAAQVGRVVQVIAMPGVDGGITMAADGRTAYVSGTPESEHADEKVAADVPGKNGDVVHVFHYDARTGQAARAGTIDVPPPSGTPIPQVAPIGIPGSGSPPQNFPPTSTKAQSWPRDLAVSPDGKTLLAALNLADRAAVIDIASKRVRYVETGHYPYGAAILRDGKRGLVSNETDGTVSVIDLASATKIKDIQVGPHLSHPEGIAVDPKADRAYVAVTHQDLIAVIDTSKLTVERTLSVSRPEGNGTAPVAVSVSRDGCFLTSADSGEDAVAVFALPRADGSTCPNDPKAAKKKKAKAKRKRKRRAKERRRRAPAFTGAYARPVGGQARSRAFELVGRVPAGDYPVDAEATPHHKTLTWVAAKGFGTGPNPNGPRPNSPLDSDDHINSFQYLPSIVQGRAGTLSFPTDPTLRKLSSQAGQILRPTNAESAPSDTPIRAPGAGQKIEHVFYIVRENRTYDQILGDDSRGDGDPKLALFPERITPNAHALARRFPLLDHVYANSEASIDGHFWTSAGNTSDYVNKNWHQNYGGRKRPYDFGVYAVTWPSQRFLFDRAEKDNVSYYNYGEAIAGTVPLNDKDRNAEETAEVARKTAKSDLGPPEGCYPNDASIGTDAITQLETFDSSLPSGAVGESRYECFRARFLSQVASGSVPAFNYFSLPNDHTQVTSPGKRTPFAMVAENDYALGQIVDLISHSSIWSKSLILVIEDDSQDGADHVDAHRIPALAISPYAKRGAVVHTRYDFLSFIRTLEIVTGMKPMNLFDALATPMYDAFSGSPDNAEPYSAVGPNVNLLERNSASTPGARASSKMPLDKLDQVPQRDLDRVLWKYVHGRKAEPPPPGPNASGVDEEAERR